MAKRAPIAVLDTSAIILVLDGKSRDEVIENRRLRVLENLKIYADEGTQFVVPAPVITELHALGDDKAVELALGKLNDARVAAFDYRSAREAMRMIRGNLPPGQGRREMKFDAMIAGVAHALGAHCLFTADPRDYRTYLKRVESSVDVVQADKPLPDRQVTFLLKVARAEPEGAEADSEAAAVGAGPVNVIREEPVRAGPMRARRPEK